MATRDKRIVCIGSDESPSTTSCEIVIIGERSDVVLTTSASDTIRRCFIGPLSNMNHHDQTFILLMGVFALYEGHVRRKLGLDTSKFPDDSPFSPEFATHFIVSVDNARKFWRTHRHGMLHRCFAEPLNANPRVDYLWNQGFGKAIECDGGTFRVNPLKVRDVILRVVESEMTIWDKTSGPTTFEFGVIG